MLKGLGALALFLVIAHPSSRGQTAPTAAGYKPKSVQQHKQALPPAPAAPQLAASAAPVVVEDQPVTITKLPTVSTEVIRDRVDYAALVISALVLLVGYFGVRYAKKTLAQIAEQTKRLGEHAEHLKGLADAAKDNAAAAKANADAAQTQAHVLATTERAWVVEYIDFPQGPLSFQDNSVAGNAKILMIAFELRNGGKSAARITRFNLRFHLARSIVDLPAQPDYGAQINVEDLGSDGVIVIPNQTKPPLKAGIALESAMLQQQDVINILGGQLVLVTYGRVEYESLGEIHTNQFCYVWSPGLGLTHDLARFRKGGPLNYNSHT